MAEGLGVSVLPTLLAAQFVERGLQLRPLDVPITHRFVVGCSTSLKESPLVKRLEIGSPPASRLGSAQHLPTNGTDMVEGDLVPHTLCRYIDGVDKDAYQRLSRTVGEGG